MSRLTRLVLAVLCIAWLTGCGNADPQPKGKGLVVVFAAASTNNAMEAIKAAFSQSTATEVRTSYAASSTLAQQMENGAEADLFLSADVKWADYIQGKLAVAKRRNLLGNRLVIVVPADSKLKLAQPADLASDDVKHLALGDPDAVPAGRYAKQALSKLGIWEKVRGKVAAAEDVRHALAYVETGAAEAGIVYATDAAVSKKVRVALEIPANLTEAVHYPVLLLKRAADNKAAESFYDYLGSPEATRVFEQFGFEVLASVGGAK